MAEDTNWLQAVQVGANLAQQSQMLPLQRQAAMLDIAREQAMGPLLLQSKTIDVNNSIVAEQDAVANKAAAGRLLTAFAELEATGDTTNMMARANLYREAAKTPSIAFTPMWRDIENRLAASDKLVQTADRLEKTIAAREAAAEVARAFQEQEKEKDRSLRTSLQSEKITAQKELARERAARVVDKLPWDDMVKREYSELARRITDEADSPEDAEMKLEALKLRLMKKRPKGTAGLPTIKAKSEYDALPSGARFIGEDGKAYSKP